MQFCVKVTIIYFWLEKLQRRRFDVWNELTAVTPRPVSIFDTRYQGVLG
jgi:hypothetical protein